MLSVLSNPVYRNLFAAQVLSLVGTGLTTVALALLAYDLAGADAGLVLGIALTLKMIAYVGVAPIAGAMVQKLPRRSFLVTLDLLRAGMVLLLPFVTEIWQIYVLVFLFQTFSAAFTPSFQATIPEILTEERDYTRALSLSRLAYDLESILSPLLAGLLLTLVSFHWLFVGNALGFLASAVLVLAAALPRLAKAREERSFAQRLTRGAWIYLRTPRLRGLLALSFVASAAGSMVIVNTVVLVRGELGGGERDVALFLAAFGAGSIVVALILPRLLDAIAPRWPMLAGGVSAAAVLAAAGYLDAGYEGALALWIALGAASSLIQTPAGLLLRRSSHAEDRPALFAAQFALSHACWLVTYPAAGWIGARAGLDTAAFLLAAASAAAVLVAGALWPRHDPSELFHEHDEVEHVHAAQQDAHHTDAALAASDGHRHRHRRLRHSHTFVIDDHHPVWPKTR